MWNELRFTLRTLWRSPVFSAAAVLSLALGIGANTAIFSLLDQVLFRMLPVPEPERLVVFHVAGGYNAPGMSMADSNETVFSYPMYRDLRGRARVFDGLIARGGAEVSLARAGEAERASADMVSGNFFDVLGVKPALGRCLRVDDDGAPGANPVIVLSYGYWMRRFGGSPTALNEKVAVNGHPMLIVGVASPQFRGLLTGQIPDLYVPIAMKRQITPNWDGLEDRRARWLNIFGRLAPGVSAEKAQAGVRVAYRPILESELAQMGRLRSDRERDRFLNQQLDLVPASQGINQLRSRLGAPLVALMAMVGLVLAIACANVAGLLLARAAGRRREVAVRLSIGASRAAVARQFLLESTVVALAGGLLGLVLANWTTRALLGALPGDPSERWLSAALDMRLFAFNLLLSICSGLLFGMAPAIQATRPDLAGALKDSPGGERAGGGRALFRRVLVTAQVALSVVLLVGAGLFSRSLWNLMSVKLGFTLDRLMTFSVNPKLNGYTDERARSFYSELQRRLETLPGVRAAGAANPGPFSGGTRGGNITVEGYQPKGDEEAGASQNAVSAGYFRALGIPLIAGREFTERDDVGAPKVAVVNETFVKRYFAGRNPLGRRMMFGSSNRPVLDREIVGVAADNKHADLREPEKPTVFTPHVQQARADRLTFYLRTSRNENEVASAIRQAVRELDPGVPVSDMRSMRVRVNEALYTDRMIAILSAAFGLLATLLAAIGLYGVVAYSVARRTSEIGLRMALGAGAGNVLWLVARESLGLILAGSAAGLSAAFALSRLVESQLYGLKANDPLVFAGAAAGLLATALVAGLIPGARAVRLDPMRALRYE